MAGFFGFKEDRQTHHQFNALFQYALKEKQPNNYSHDIIRCINEFTGKVGAVVVDIVAKRLKSNDPAIVHGILNLLESFTIECNPQFFQFLSAKSLLKRMSKLVERTLVPQKRSSSGINRLQQQQLIAERVLRILLYWEFSPKFDYPQVHVVFDGLKHKGAKFPSLSIEDLRRFTGIYTTSNKHLKYIMSPELQTVYKCGEHIIIIIEILETKFPHQKLSPQLLETVKFSYRVLKGESTKLQTFIKKFCLNYADDLLVGSMAELYDRVERALEMYYKYDVTFEKLPEKRKNRK